MGRALGFIKADHSIRVSQISDTPSARPTPRQAWLCTPARQPSLHPASSPAWRARRTRTFLRSLPPAISLRLSRSPSHHSSEACHRHRELVHVLIPLGEWVAGNNLASLAMSRPRILASVEAGARLLLVGAAVLLCLSARPGRAAPLGAEVAEFPGFVGNLPSKHYAGYDLSSIYEKSERVPCRSDARGPSDCNILSAFNS